METSTLRTQMLEYFARLSDAEQRSVLQRLKTFTEGRDNFQPMSIEEYNRELEEADAEIETGHYIIHEELKKKYFQ